MTHPLLAALVSDRRCWLFAVIAGLAGVLGFVAVPDQLAIKLVSKVGFWFVLAAFVIWVRALWLTLSADLKAWSWRKADWASIAVVTVGGVVLLAHESFGFKIVMDEIMLLGTSMSMHLDKTALTPLRGNDIQGAFVVIEGIVDKRPLFFPFLLSLLHDVTGYRPANAFALNAGLTFFFLGLVCMIGRRLAGRVAGWLGVVLFAGLPLLAHNSTGGGFELLNLTMIAATLLLGMRWLEKRDDHSLAAFCFSGLLLAQVRYESVIYLLPVALLVLWGWKREGRVLLPWPVLVAPLLMVHYPLQHRIFDVRASAWEMASKPGYSKPFSFSYVRENLEHAIGFFFADAKNQPNSLVLSALGLIAVVFVTVIVARRMRLLSAQSPAMLATMAFGLGLALQFLLLMCYFWGKFDDPVIRRLSLPTHLALVIAILMVVAELKRPAVIRVLLGIAVVGLLTRSVPSMAAHAYSQEYLAGRETAWRRAFMAAQPRPDYLMIDNDSTLWVTHCVSATPTTVAVQRQADLAFFLRNRMFSAIYVFQRLRLDLGNEGKQALREGDDLGPAFVLETVREERMHPEYVSRISRVTEIREGEVSLSAPPVQPPEPLKDRAEIEQARQLFLENFMKKLP
ncbi:MAG: glycosyltransferase family 39 protein [Opitutaceae bacterium]